MAYFDEADYNNNIGYVPEDCDVYSVSSYVTAGSVNSRVKKNKKLLEDMKSSDKGYRCVKRGKS